MRIASVLGVGEGDILAARLYPDEEGAAACTREGCSEAAYTRFPSPTPAIPGLDSKPLMLTSFSSHCV